MTDHKDYTVAFKVQAHYKCYRELRTELLLENLNADEIHLEFVLSNRVFEAIHASTCEYRGGPPDYVPTQWTP